MPGGFGEINGEAVYPYVISYNSLIFYIAIQILSCPFYVHTLRL